MKTSTLLVLFQFCLRKSMVKRLGKPAVCDLFNLSKAPPLFQCVNITITHTIIIIPPYYHYRFITSIIPFLSAKMTLCG